MKFLVSFFLASSIFVFSFPFEEKVYPCKNSLETNPVSSYEGQEDENFNETMVPIPMKDRVYNKTTIQCVWASIECLGRYAQEPKLINLIEDKDCKGYASPSSLSNKLKKLNVKFEQTTSRSNRNLIVKSVVKERRGCLFGVPGHAMVLVHYDESKGIVKYINNSDRTLRIRTWTLKEFNQRWDGWICAVYADKDIIPKKYTKVYPIPIIDKIEAQGNYEKDYILIPLYASCQKTHSL